MPIPKKPCDGRFNDELQAILTQNRNREQWSVHPCPQCGTSVGAVQLRGAWVPEQHWPSVTYQPRKVAAKSTRLIAPREVAVSAD